MWNWYGLSKEVIIAILCTEQKRLSFAWAMPVFPVLYPLRNICRCVVHQQRAFMVVRLRLQFICSWEAC